MKVISEASKIFDRSGEADDDEKDDSMYSEKGSETAPSKNNAKEQQRFTTGETGEDGGIDWIMSDVDNEKKCPPPWSGRPP